jgi:hypothetical protein
MKNGRYIFLLSVLTLLLFGASEWLSINPKIPNKLSQSQKNSNKKSLPKYQRNEKSQSQPIRMVTLYPSGSIVVEKVPVRVLAPKKPPNQAKKYSKPKRKPVRKRRPAAKKNAVVSPRLKGDRPNLEVSYQGIGFEKYIDVIERVGRLFVLVEEEGRLKLGPEVSLKRQEVFLSSGFEKGRYALDRPHLISDPYINSFLSVLNLPKTAITDRVVLVFNSPFDNLLWSVISNVAAEHNLKLSNLSQISGEYIDNGDGIFLQFSHARFKNSQIITPFNRTIRVTL